MRELALAGLVAIAFGLGSYYATASPEGGDLGLFGWINLLGGTLALVVAGIGGASRLRGLGSPAGRRVLLPRVLGVLGCALVTGALVWALDALDWRFDWTADQRFELSEATLSTLAELPAPVNATFYSERFDPRSRRTRFLLETLAANGPIQVRERNLSEAAVEAERFGVSTPNSVVLEAAGNFDLIERPNEGTLLESILRLHRRPQRRLYVTLGEGEGNLAATANSGFSGLGAALETEGYELLGLVPALIEDVPADADALLVIGPRRQLPQVARNALRQYLENGGAMVALLDPGPPTGFEEVLADFGITRIPGLIVDAASGPIEGGVPGVNPVSAAYADHPVTERLDGRALTFFLGAAPMEASRKPMPEDRLTNLVFTSPRAWLSQDVERVERGMIPQRPGDSELRRYSMAAAGRYPRGGEGKQTRIVAFGDSDFASNRYLRSLYNLDLILNAVHWATDRDVDITLRPKMLTPDQDPLPPQKTLEMLYGVGLLVPEILLIIGTVLWSRQRFS